MSDDEPPARERVRLAIREVRREGYKAAAVHAVVDAALALVVATTAIRALGPGRVPGPETVSVPAALADPTGVASASTAALVGAVAAVVVGVAEFGLLVRRPLVERFEDANPAVAEALRTARDAVADGRDGPMARRLYEGVLADLRAASSAGLVSVPRVAATVVVVLAVGLAGVQVAVVDLGGRAADPGAGAGTGGGTDGATGDEFEGLRDGDEILGDPTDVDAGDNPQNATVDPSQAGGDLPGPPPESYGDAGYAPGIDSQQAGYVDEPPPEDADLIRAYNLAIREGGDPGDQEDTDG